MPTFAVGNMIEAFNGRDLMLFTANHVITPRGLVMGAGAAKAFRTAFPFLPDALASAIGEEQTDYLLALVEHPAHPGRKTLGALQNSRNGSSRDWTSPGSGGASPTPKAMVIGLRS
jgi:hypothetical protein